MQAILFLLFRIRFCSELQTMSRLVLRYVKTYGLLNHVVIN